MFSLRLKDVSGLESIVDILCDPFCGCDTNIAAAQKRECAWPGIVQEGRRILTGGGAKQNHRNPHPHTDAPRMGRGNEGARFRRPAGAGAVLTTYPVVVASLHHRLISVSPPGWLRTIGQLLAGMAFERPSGDVVVDETFKKAPTAKGKAAAHLELEL